MNTEETPIMMGITVEDLTARINHVYELAKSQEGVDLKAEANNLKAAIKENGSICQYLLPEDIGKLVQIVKGFHASAREEAMQTPAQKKAAKSKEAAEAKKMLARPITAEELANDLADL
jgi:hypothetical protein